MKTKLITALPLCLLALHVQAQPQVCPTVAEIKAGGVSHNVAQEATGQWFTGRRNQTYGTGDHWTFILGKITATTVDDAYNKAVTSLDSLVFQLGPVIGPIGKWVCYYNNIQGYTAVAVNPPVATVQAKSFL